MLEGYRVYDADAHVYLSPRMWEDLSPEFAYRRPRPVMITDAADMGRWTASWLIDGRMEPHPFGPGAQPANTPLRVSNKLDRDKNLMEFRESGLDLSDPEARLQDLERLGIDVQMVFPSTVYARVQFDAGLESALYRSYNRYMARQCNYNPNRLKWAGLLPLGDSTKACQSIEEMALLGASAVVVFGTAGEDLLSTPRLDCVWEQLAQSKLPLCVHMGMSYPPFEKLCRSIFDAHIIGMSLPAQLAFAALVGHGMLDRYSELKIAFLEFGAEWLFYMVGRIGHYLPIDRGQIPGKSQLPAKEIEEYLKSGRIFIAPEAEDSLLPQEMELLGKHQVLFSSDFPHGEGRENSALTIIRRSDLSDEQKRTILYDNSVRLFGEPGGEMK